jgi:hypothetical protein
MGEVTTPSIAPLGIYTHIEKTAGTSVRDALERAVGTSGLYLYSGRPGTSPFLDKMMMGLSYPVTRALLAGPYSRLHNVATRRMLAKGSENIPSDASVVMGHFIADQFDEALGERSSIRAVTLREPLSRLISHFDDWKRLKGHHDWRVQVPYDPDLKFEDFATLPQMQNYQLRALGRLGLEDFDVVGVTESVDQSVGQFLGLLAEAGTISGVPGAETLHISRYNRSPRSRKTNLEALSPSTIQSIRQFHAEDIDLYAQAVAISSSAT